MLLRKKQVRYINIMNPNMGPTQNKYGLCKSFAQINMMCIYICIYNIILNIYIYIHIIYMYIISYFIYIYIKHKMPCPNQKKLDQPRVGSKIAGCDVVWIKANTKLCPKCQNPIDPWQHTPQDTPRRWMMDEQTCDGYLVGLILRWILR